MRETILVLPCSTFQIPLMQKAWSRGFIVACADRNPECPGAQKADLFFPISLDRREDLLRVARDISPRAILTDQTDAAVSVVAWLADMMNLPGIGEDCARLFTDKQRMREFTKSQGFPTPDFRCCASLGEALDAADKIGYPLVIKPVDSQASKGVHRIENKQQLETLFSDAAKYASKGEVIVEKFLEGVEFTVEGFMTHVGHRTLGISEKRHYPASPMVARSLEFTPLHPYFDYAALRDTHDRLINATGLPFGMTHSEYKYTGGEFHLIEMAVRGGGTRIASDIVPWISGVNYQELLLDAALGQSIPDIPQPLASRCALLEFFDFPSGHIHSFEGIDLAKAMPGVLDIVMNCKIGQRLCSIEDDTQRPGYFILTTETKSELSVLRDLLLSTVRVEVKP